MIMNYKILFIFLMLAGTISGREIFVSPIGSDNGSGTEESPYATFSRALVDVKEFAGTETITVWFNDGTYYLQKTIEIGSAYSGTEAHPVIFSALPGAQVTVKGSKYMDNLSWTVHKDGIYKTQIPTGVSFDQLFINGERQVRARFPNYDYQNPIRGGKGYQKVTDGTNNRYDQWFSFNPDNFTDKVWQNPETGIVHAFQSHNWGNMQYRIKNVNREENKVYLGEGGWQLQRNHGIGGREQKASDFFIENIFEELDVPGEWFLDIESNLLYYYHKAGVKLSEAKIEVPIIKDLIQLKGTKDSPVKHVQFKGFYFTQSQYTFMDNYEPLARGDWAIHRGGAIYMEGVENCTVTDCSFEYLGGNGVFMSGYNRNNEVKNSQFVHVGESAVCFVGLPSAVRFYQTWDDREILGKDWDEMREGMDLELGPKTADYPKNCVVENSIMHDFGDVGKQVAGIYISMSHKIRASHNTIYNCPRAGICINDGTWGGHIIEHNDIWETVQETGEHGPFNSWGRERQWKGSRGSDEDFIKELTKLDAIDNVIIRNNRIANYRKSISAGNWTIDLDDGSSYFEIYNNLNLGSTIKLRDGMARKVYNNITVSAVPLGWHVWPKNSEDEIYKNIFVISGAVPGKKEPTDRFIRDVRLPEETKWSTNYDDNLYWNVNFKENPNILEDVSLDAWQKKGYDLNAQIADPLFVDPENGNYQVRINSPALKLGFENFSMDDFGHQMTRIIPFGGEFSEEVTVHLKADQRAGKDAKIYFTIDGSEPSIQSLIYKNPIQLQQSTVLKVRTFTSDNIPVDFVAQTKFKKVDEVIYPSWLSTLLAGNYEGDVAKTTTKAFEKEVLGALFINIGDDPDLIDATGGYDYGCYIKNIDSKKGKVWMDSKLNADWVIQQINGNKVRHIADMEKYLKKYQGQTVTITGARDYKVKTFKVKLP